MALSLKNSLLTAIFIVAPQKASLISGMARISPIWTNRPPSGGATGKPTTRAHSAPKKSGRFHLRKCPHGGNASTPSDDSGKKNVPDAMRKRPNRPDRNGMRQECATPAIPTCGARAFQLWKAYGRHGTAPCLFLLWMPQTICKVCNASILMEQSVFLWAARYLEDNSSFRGSRKSLLPFVRGLLRAQVSILPQAGRSMWPFPQTISQEWPRP